MNNSELLAPVGKMENAIAAIENGADALFVGGKLFNARQYADNFSQDELEEIVKYAKLRDVKVYVTVNILIKEEETKELYAYLSYLETVGVHAIITQDLGVAAMVREHFPRLRLHASTQMSAHSLQDVLFLKSLGFKRVVLARELKLQEIKEIIDHCDIEIETFIHGALCYSYSGQCLMSSLIGGRSGNRGRCAQPCRMKYSLLEDNKTLVKEAYLLSLKDICSVEFLPELLACGIHSFKIEGRMKSPEYVASVVKTYKKYIDLAGESASYKVEEEDLEVLKGVFNRGGFSKGYYFEHGTKDMLTPISPRHIGLRAGKVTHFAPKTGIATILLERNLNPGDGLEIIRSGKESVGTGISKPCEKGSSIKCQFDKYIEVGSEVYLTKNHQLLKSLRSTYQKPQRKIPIAMQVVGRLGQPIEIHLQYKDIKTSYKGAILEAATNAPLTKEQALKQLSKLGSTTFFVETSEMHWDEGIYLPISQLNEMRRMAISQLEEALLQVQKKEHLEYVPLTQGQDEEEGRWTAHVRDLGQLEACLKRPEITVIYWEWQYDIKGAQVALEACLKANKAFYLALPYIMKETSLRTFEKEMAYWEDSAITGYLIRTYGTYYLLKDTSKKITVDYNLNVMNNENIRLWEKMGADTITVSVELTSDEIADLRGTLEKIVYGHIPVMTSQQCILRHTQRCQKGQKEKKVYEIQDRKDMLWGIQTDCTACTMQLLSHEPLVFKPSELQRAKKSMSLRLYFNYESYEETEAILKAYFEAKEGMPNGLKAAAFKTIL